MADLSIETPDPARALWKYLGSVTNINTLTEGRLYGRRLPDAQAKDMPRAAVVVVGSGGPGSVEFNNVLSNRFDFRSYGKTPAEAGRLGLMIYRALKNINNQLVENCLIHRCEVDSGPIDYLDPDTLWPYSVQSFVVHTGEYPVGG